MDRISHLPEEIITKILSFLETKHVTGTMVLSKRWKSLWKIVPRLNFDDSESLEPEYWKFQKFVDRSLISHQGQVLQSLNLRLTGKYADDTAIWVETAVKLGLMELELKYVNFPPGFFPKSIYTCSTLVVLKLQTGTLDVPHLVSLPSLKTLSLRCWDYSDRDCLIRLLPNCPLLEDLLLDRRRYYMSGEVVFKIVVPSLKKLTLRCVGYLPSIPGVLIDAPCLKYLKIYEGCECFTLAETINSNELVEANVMAILHRTDKVLQSLASVERLRLCLHASEFVSPVDSCFRRLKYLEMCTCYSRWLDIFMHLLKNSPNLKVIKFNKFHGDYPQPQWNQPGSVPRCFFSNLETFEWKNYQGTPVQKELSTYILKNAVCLKKASFITAKSIDDHKKKLQMLQELAFPPRISTTCELSFN